MTKRELRKEAYRRIIKENATHQEVFDELQHDKSFSKEEIAQILSGIPSRAVVERVKVLKIIFIGVLAVIILMRIVGIALVSSVIGVNPVLLALMVLFGLVVPAMGIFGLVTHRYELLKSVSFLFIFSIIRSLRKLDTIDTYTAIEFVPYGLAIILGFWLLYISKTPYKRVVKEEENPDLSIRKVSHIVFEEPKAKSGNDLLDSGL
jgi:hypothetical protein